MINEVTTRKESHRAISKSKKSVVELCTCMPNGWVYAYSMQEKDIYVYFDNAIYVTVADVQSAALRIKESFV